MRKTKKSHGFLSRCCLLLFLRGGGREFDEGLEEVVVVEVEVVVAGAEEGLEVAGLVPQVEGGDDEGQEEEGEADDGALGTGLLHWHGGGLKEGEGRGIFLYLSLGHLELANNLRVGLVLQVHLVAELELLAADAV